MEPTGPSSLVRLPPPSSLSSGLPMLPLPQGYGPAASSAKTFQPTRIFPALPSPSPSLLARLPQEAAPEVKQPALSSPAPAPPASSWVLYNSAQADSKRRKVARTQFTEEQKNILNHYFVQRNHMKNYKPLEIKDIERETGLTEHQIRIYFQNKRARTKAKQSGSPPPQSPPMRFAVVAPTPVMPPTTELPQRLPSLPSPLKRKEPSPAPPSPPQQGPAGTRSSASAFAIAPTRDGALHGSPNRLDLLAPASAAVGDISTAREAGATHTQLNTLNMIDSITARMCLTAADAAQAKELMCGVFDGKHVPRTVLAHANCAALIAASCLHIARRQNLRPLPVAAFEESLALPQGVLPELIDHIISGMRLILNDVDATEYVAKALARIDLPEGKLGAVRAAALSVLDAAKRSEQQAILRNPAALAAAALLVAAKRIGVPLDYASAAGPLKVCQWSVRSKEDELLRLLNQ